MTIVNLQPVTTYTINRRWKTFLQVPELQASIRGGGMFYRRRPIPTTVQFNGTVVPAGVYRVYLHRRGESTPIDYTATDVHGYFEFTGWYYELTDYEYTIMNDEASATFQLSRPEYVRFVGNPRVRPSDGYTRE